MSHESRAVEPEFFSVEDFAAKLAVNHKLVRRLISENKITAVRIGRILRIPKSELDKFRNPAGGAHVGS